MRSRQVSLPRLRWRTTPGSSDPGSKRASARPCRVRISSSTGPHVSAGSALGSGASGAVARRRRHHRDHVARLDRRARLQVDHGPHDPGARRRDERLHLHGADDHHGRPGVHGVAFADAHLDHRPAHRATSTATSPSPTGSWRAGCRRRRRRRRRPPARPRGPAGGAAPRRRRRRPRHRPRAARDVRPAASSARRRHGASGWESTAAREARLVRSPPMWNSSSARRVRSIAAARSPVEPDVPITLARRGSNCGGGA